MNKKQWNAQGFMFLVVALIMSMLSLNAITQLFDKLVNTTTDYTYSIEMCNAQTWCVLTALSCMTAIVCWGYSWLKEDTK